MSRVRRWRVNFDSSEIAAGGFTRIETGKSTHATRQLDVGASFSHPQIESQLPPIVAAVKKIRDDPILEDADVSTGVACWYTFGAHTRGEMVPTRCEMKLLCPTGVVRFEARNLHLTRRARRMLPIEGGEVRPALPSLGAP